MKLFLIFCLLLSHLFTKSFAQEEGGPMSSFLQQAQKEFICNPSKENFSSYTDWKEATYAVTEEERLLAEKLIQDGKVGCLLLAGGQGSRLGEGVAKGKVEVSFLKKKSLFQIFFEKVLYASLQAKRKLPIAVMTSSQNHEETVSFLAQNNWFGLSEDQVYFFTQEDLPFCDERGDWIESDGSILQGPNGNGMALHRFYETGVWEAFHRLGVEHLNMIQVDNPLADPFDKDFIGFHHIRGSDLSAIGVEKLSDQEKAGMFASDQGALRVIEYSEKQDQKFSFLNTGLLCFKMEFVKNLGKDNLKMPWHIAYKKTGDRFVWKFEYFIFDVFAYAKDFSLLIKPRQDCFSPLKNATGDKSIETVRKDLLHKDMALYQKFTGKLPKEKIELSFDFSYPTEKQIQDWKQATWPIEGYITPQALVKRV